LIILKLNNYFFSAKAQQQTEFVRCCASAPL